jgi:outer membrane protein assembly factor BamB
MVKRTASTRTTALLLLGLAAKTACSEPAGAALWSADLGYLSRETFARSTFRADGVLVQGRDTLQLLDPATGAVRWSRPATTSAFPAGELAPIWIAAEAGDALALEELDPATGASKRQVELSSPLSPNAELTWVGSGRLLITGTTDVRLVDVERGAAVWERSFAKTVRRERVVGDWVLVRDDDTYRALALSDGGERWQRPGVCCAAVSDDGDAIYLPLDEARSARVGASGEVLEEIAGAVAAVDRQHVALLSADGLVVRPHGGAAPTFTLARPAADSLGAVALSGGSVFYFRGDDDTLWRHDLTAGQTTRVTTWTAGGVISPDGSGAAEPHLDVPPVWAPPYLFVGERRLQALRLPR